MEHSVDDFFIYSDHLASVQDARSTGRFSFALDYRYDRATGDLVIGYSRPREHRFSLSEALQLPAVAAAAAAAPGPSSSTSPSSSSWISTPFTVLVKTGDDDGINLPWFAPADAALLFWEIHSDTADVPLRVKVTNASSVEIWPDSREWVRPVLPLVHHITEELPDIRIYGMSGLTFHLFLELRTHCPTTASSIPQ